MKPLILFCLLLTTIFVHAQVKDLSSFPNKGTYLWFRQPAYEDNSFLLDEAFTQPKGVLQNIMTVYARKNDFALSFTQQIPVSDRHQLAYTFNYSAVGSGGDSGFGDLYLHYAYAWKGKQDKILLMPEFTLIVPTGKNRGYGGWGGQFTLAATKRISQKVMTHYNIGYSYVAQADFITSGTRADRTFFEQDLHLQNAGASVVWYVTRRFNLMFESTAGGSKKLVDTHTERVFNLTLNPGFRVLFENEMAQFVPGFSVPLNFENSNFAGAGVFIYFSYEPDYLGFFKEKSR
ncbi:MAG: hypothetical protein WDO14_18970 [Bacteroidota bacterium]